MIYVDDMLFFGSNTDKIIQPKRHFSQRFKMKDLGPCKKFLGIQVTRDRERQTLRLDQTEYLRKVLEDHHMDDSKPVATPMEQGLHLPPPDPGLPDQLAKLYQSAIGSLMYVMLNTRPDLAYTLSRLSQYLTNPTDMHWRALKRVLHYVKGTLHYSITYGGLSTGDLHGYTDSDWAGNKETRRSTRGYVFQLGNGPISWKSKLQPTVALSSCEAEYMAATQATKEVVWLRRLLAHLGQLNSDPTEDVALL